MNLWTTASHICQAADRLFGDWRPENLEAGTFVRKRQFTIAALLKLWSFSAFDGGRQGDEAVIGELWRRGLFSPSGGGKLPLSGGYSGACMAAPADLGLQAAREAYLSARAQEKTPVLWQGFRVMVNDGTKIIIPRTPETIAAYELPGGRTGNAYYPQIHAVGFFDLATRTFATADLSSGKPDERGAVLRHATANTEATLYVQDAGCNGVAYLFQMSRRPDHAVLMTLKMGNLGGEVTAFRRSKLRSRVITLTLQKIHIASYPELESLVGASFQVRLLRQPGSSKLRSQILVTTLLDEDRYPRNELILLHLQRGKIEFGFRHLKTLTAIEHIRKLKLRRILQHIGGALLAYNLAAILRYAAKPPELFPDKEGAAMPAFSAAFHAMKDVVMMAAAGLKAWTDGDWRKILLPVVKPRYRYRPFRLRPRITQFPSSVFTRQKTSGRHDELRKTRELARDMKRLGMFYALLRSML